MHFGPVVGGFFYWKKRQRVFLRRYGFFLRRYGFFLLEKNGDGFFLKKMATGVFFIKEGVIAKIQKKLPMSFCISDRLKNPKKITNVLLHFGPIEKSKKNYQCLFAFRTDSILQKITNVFLHFGPIEKSKKNYQCSFAFRTDSKKLKKNDKSFCISDRFQEVKKKQIIRSEAKSQRIAACAALPDTTPWPVIKSFTSDLAPRRFTIDSCMALAIE